MFWNRIFTHQQSHTKKAESKQSKTQETLLFEQQTVLIKRRFRKRTLTLKLAPNQPITVSVGQSVTHKRILEFLLEKKDWIEKNLAQMQELKAKHPDKTYSAFEDFLFLGVKKPLKFEMTLLKKVFVSQNEKALCLHLPLKNFTEGSLKDSYPEHADLVNRFYKREAIRYITERVRALSLQTQLIPKKIGFRAQKTRWGSCSSKGHISLNWKLIVAPPEVVDYVIVHELCHLRHLNHSDRFWALVNSHCPYYIEAEKWLKANHFEAEFLS